jgi:hypothetical protein
MRDGEVVRLPVEVIPVAALATDGKGQIVVVLRRVGPSFWQAACLVQEEGGYRAAGVHALQSEGDVCLGPVLGNWNDRPMAWLWNDAWWKLLLCPRLIAVDSGMVGGLFGLPVDWVLPLSPFGWQDPARESATLVFDRGTIRYFQPGIFGEPRQLGWCPATPNSSTLRQATVSWLRKGSQELELAGLDQDGNVCWSDLELPAQPWPMVTTLALANPEGYLAAAVVRPGLVAAITPRRVHWLRRRQAALVPAAYSEVRLPAAVACFPHYQSNELIVVSGDGTVARLPMRG